MIAPFITLFINLAWGIGLERWWGQEPGVRQGVGIAPWWAQGLAPHPPRCAGGATVPCRCLGR